MRDLNSYNAHELETLGAEIKQIRFSHMTLHLEFLEGRRLIDCEFDHVAFSGTHVKPFLIAGGSFSSCKWDQAVLGKGYLRASTFFATSFRETKLVNCLIQECRFEKSDLRCLTLDATTFVDCQIVQSQLDYLESSASFFVNVDFLHPDNSVASSLWKENHFAGCSFPSTWDDTAVITVEDVVRVDSATFKSRPKSQTELALEVKEEEKPRKKSAPLTKEPLVQKETAPTASKATPEVPAGSRFSFIPIPEKET